MAAPLWKNSERGLRSKAPPGPLPSLDSAAAGGGRGEGGRRSPGSKAAALMKLHKKPPKGRELLLGPRGEGGLLSFCVAQGLPTGLAASRLASALEHSLNQRAAAHTEEFCSGCLAHPASFVAPTVPPLQGWLPWQRGGKDAASPLPLPAAPSGKASPFISAALPEERTQSGTIISFPAVRK